MIGHIDRTQMVFDLKMLKCSIPYIIFSTSHNILGSSKYTNGSFFYLCESTCVIPSVVAILNCKDIDRTWSIFHLHGSSYVPVKKAILHELWTIYVVKSNTEQIKGFCIFIFEFYLKCISVRKRFSTHFAMNWLNSSV